MIHIVTGTFNINKMSQRARHTFVGQTKNIPYTTQACQLLSVLFGYQHILAQINSLSVKCSTAIQLHLYI